jgi:hypothetical protein
MTYSVSHPARRTPSARTLAVAGAITVGALTASALTALALPGAHAGGSHTRSGVTPAAVVLAGGYPSGYNPFNLPDPTSGAAGGGTVNSGAIPPANSAAGPAVVAGANAVVTPQEPDFRTALNPPVGSNVLDLRATLSPFSVISPVNPSADGLLP